MGYWESEGPQKTKYTENTAICRDESPRQAESPHQADNN